MQVNRAENGQIGAACKAKTVYGTVSFEARNFHFFGNFCDERGL